ncbi:MAG: RNA polymerase sigma factor [Terracidiphilus sp.]
MGSANQPADRSDGALLHLALIGEEAAFLELYHRLKDGIFRYAFYMSSSTSVAEEVTQEVFICLLKEGHKYHAGLGDVAAFAFGIARNFIRRIKRRERPYEPLPANQALENLAGILICESEAVSTHIIRSELVGHVQAAVASLPGHYRQTVVLCDLCEISYADAASRLRCSIGTIRSRLNRGHNLLAQKLKRFRRSQPEMGSTATETWVHGDVI